MYGFRNLNAKQSGTNERLVKGEWHDMEIRTVGQQFTVLVDGEIVNQFDNAVPNIASRDGDPSTMARQFAAGCIGLQTHGGADRISYRDPGQGPRGVRPPGQRRAAQGRGLGSRRPPADLRARRVGEHAGREPLGDRYRSDAIGPDRPRHRAPSQLDLGDITTLAEPEYGTQPLRWLDPLVVGHGRRYVPTAADVAKVIHCAVSADNGGATEWETAGAPGITAAR